MHATILLIKRQKSCFRIGFKPLKKYMHATHSGSKLVVGYLSGQNYRRERTEKKNV